MSNIINSKIRMNLIFLTLITIFGLSLNVNAMNLNEQATCAVIFSTTSSLNRQQGNLDKSAIWNKKMLDMINNMRAYGYDDDTITKSLGSNFLNAVNMMKNIESNPDSYKKYINECLDEIEKKNLNIDIQDKYGNIYKEVISPYTGRIWLDRNLGAKRVCQFIDDTQCYGDYFQWGRDSDGHEKADSSITNIISNSINPPHSKFIISDSSYNKNWLLYVDNTLWGNDNNNPCPINYKVPSKEEISAEISKIGTGMNMYLLYDSFLKLPINGVRSGKNGRVYFKNSWLWGGMWTSTIQNNEVPKGFYINNDNAYFYSGNFADGQAVRCIKKLNN